MLILVLALVSCAHESDVGGPLQVQLIQSVGPRCQYTIAPTTIQTLDSLTEMRGKLGIVVTSALNLGSQPDLLNYAIGFQTVDSQFLKSGNDYYPTDFTSLFAASLYYAVETGYFLHAKLNPEADFVKTVPGFAAKTLMVYNAIDSDGTDGDVIIDNAEYLPHSIGNTGLTDRNYIFSYPNDSRVQMPLGLNLGIMVHEYTHLVFNYLFFEKMVTRGETLSSSPENPTESTLSAVNEGLADYFGFVAAKDPSYFLCSFPSQDRDLSIPKYLTAELRSQLSLAASDPTSPFDPHVVGAVFAAINYEIGNAIGHEENARTLSSLIATLLDCAGARGQGSIALNFDTVVRCHVAVGGAHSTTIQQIYQSRISGRNP